MGNLTGSDTPQAIKAMTLISQHNRAIDAIRADRNLTPEGKLRQIAGTHLDYKQQINKLEADDIKARATKADTLRRTLFGLYGNSDPNALISYRDAQDRVAAIDNEQKALALLDRADLSNDEVLAKAIVGKAAESGWHNVVGTYTQTHPYYGEKLQELAVLSNADTSIEAIMNHTMSYNLSAPAEISRYSDGMLQNLSTGAQP